MCDSKGGDGQTLSLHTEAIMTLDVCVETR